jgi:hypothetical protein
VRKFGPIVKDDRMTKDVILIGKGKCQSDLKSMFTREAINNDMALAKGRLHPNFYLIRYPCDSPP